MRSIIILAFLVCYHPLDRTTANAQQPPKSGNTDLKQYEIHAYIQPGYGHPVNIIWFDNIAEFLFACQKGKSLDQLRQSDIRFVDSQIRLLLD